VKREKSVARNQKADSAVSRILSFVPWLLSFEVLVSGTLAFAVLTPAYSVPAEYAIERQIRYSFTLENTLNSTLKEGGLWVSIPLEQTATQWCLNVKASDECELTTNSFGNRVLHFTVELPPYGSRIVSITADLKLADKPQSINKQFENSVSESDKKTTIENRQSKVTEIAGNLKGANPSATARNIYQWVADNLKYSGFHAANRGALWALRNRKGDCTEYAALFTALCRANGIPARMLSGFVCPKSMILKPYSLHDWAEFYDGSIWVMADPEQKNFNVRQANYIAFKILEQADPDQAVPLSLFRFEGPGLTVRMDK